MKRILTTLGLALAFTGGARAAGFSPVAIDPSSFNHDVVIEAAAARSLNDVVNATMDGGTNKSGNTFYERGYDPLFPNTGLPVAGSTITTNSHTYGYNRYSFEGSCRKLVYQPLQLAHNPLR